MYRNGLPCLQVVCMYKKALHCHAYCSRKPDDSTHGIFEVRRICDCRMSVRCVIRQQSDCRMSVRCVIDLSCVHMW